MAVVITVAGLTGHAHANVEVGGTAGLRIFSETNGIGVDEAPEADSQKNTALFGIRLGYYFNKMFGVEAELGGIPGEGRAMLYDVWNLTYRASIVAQFRAEGENQIVPFVLLGGGLHTIVDSTNTDAIGTGTSPVPHAGIGMKYRAGNGFGVRVDGRLLLPPSSAGGITADFELLASIYRDFGWKKPPVKVKEQEPPKKEEEDLDKDGLIGAADACPNEAEDQDGFQDEDGCPDPDNDGDGIADAGDKCPGEPEDKDGYQDEDGCPDPDNDGDGFADAVDKCASEPETKNGYLDDDGCPDEVPEKLKQLMAAPLAVAFKANAADLAPGAAKLLDPVALTLAEIPDGKLEIGVHTDDQAPAKGSKFADNLALSQARAEAVKAYLVGKGVAEGRLVAKGYGDSVPVEDPKDQKGAKLAAARAKNRRVELKLADAVAAPAAPAPAAPAAPAPAAPAATPATP